VVRERPDQTSRSEEIHYGELVDLRFGKKRRKKKTGNKKRAGLPKPGEKESSSEQIWREKLERIQRERGSQKVIES